MIFRAATLCAALAIAGCLDGNAGFTCGADNACNSGICIAQACAGADATCPMGYRWDSSAGSRAGKCAVIPDMAVEVPPDMIDPNCGNGTIDPGETCDPGANSPLPCPPNDQACDDKEPCTTDFVSGAPCHQRCAHSYANDTTPCPVPDGGAPGVCYGAKCCRFCWDGARCTSGDVVTVCGHAGAACADCQTTGQDAGTPECLTNVCNGMRSCEHDPVTDGTPCQNNTGTCVKGVCCPGCIDKNGLCQTGNTDAACGSNGNGCVACSCGKVNNKNACLNCMPLVNCMNKQCGSDGCGGSCGSCGSVTEPEMCDGNGKCACDSLVENSDALCGNQLDDNCDGKIDCMDPGCNLMRCMPGGFCQGNQCVPGCRINGVFVAKGTRNPPLTGCQWCDPTVDDTWSDDDGASCSGANAAPGICHADACCTTCWDSGQGKCSPAISGAFCGSGGGNCADCDDKNVCTVDACVAGKCVSKAVANGTQCGAVDHCRNACGSCGHLLPCSIAPTCQAGACTDGNEAEVQCCTLGCSVDGKGVVTCLL